MNELKKILKLTREQKKSGIWIDTINSKIVIGIQNMPKDFTGKYKEWWDNGQLFVHCFFEYGLKHGEYKKWYVSGQLFVQYFFEYGLKHGECKRWYESGQLYEHGLYEHGKIVKDFLK